MKYLLFLLYAFASVFAVNYFAEVNRFILLLAVYPGVALAGLGLYAYIESN